MKQNLLISLIIVQTLLFITFGGFFLRELGKLLNYEQPIEQTTKYDIVKVCEYFSSQATNKNWSYVKCLENLEKSLEKDLGLEKLES